MAHFAKLDENNVVVSVHVVSNDALDPDNEENSGIELLKSIHGEEHTFVQTSYNNNFRARFAGIGYTFHPEYGENGSFVAPKPFESWSFNPVSLAYEAPIPKPEITELEEVWMWDEDGQNWYDAGHEVKP